MIKVDDIREIDFSTSMSGYKKSEVDDFLDELAIDYENLLKQNQELSQKVNANTVSEVKTVEPENTTEAVHGILESAQRFSEQLINEAKQKAEEILTAAALKAKELEDKVEADKRDHEQLMLNLKAQVEAEAADKLKAAAEKSELLIVAAKDSVARQQLLFDKLRVDADNFKTGLLNSYKKQLELLNEYPTAVPFELKKQVEAAEVAKTEESEPDVETKEEPKEKEDVVFFEGLKN